MSNTKVTGTKTTGVANYLESMLGKPVVVKLNDGIEYKGVLACLDGFMNVALSQATEVAKEKKTFYGDLFLRGNNVLYLNYQ